MTWLRRLIAEAHRRSLWQVLGIYTIAAWGGFTVIKELTEVLGLPPWVPPFAIVLFIIGLPVVLATAFVQEGIVPRPALPDDQAAPTTTGLNADGIGGTQTPRAKLQRFLTWKRALLAGGAAFALMGVGTAGLVALGAAGIGPAASLASRGIIAERDEILVADFVARGVDGDLAATVADALRIDLAQSSFVQLVTREVVAEWMARMQRDAPLDEATALELARRAGFKAVLVGDVNAAGSGYILNASLLAATRGEPVLPLRETAANADALIGAIDRLSKKLRARIGESLRSVNQAPALEEVTSASFEALTLYTQGVAAGWRGDTDAYIALLEQAVAVDSTFARAWDQLANALTNTVGVEARIIDAVTNAHRLGDRLPEDERLAIEARYEHLAQGNVERARDIYRVLAERNGDASSRANWGFREYILGNYAEAERIYKDAIEDFPNLANLYGNLSRTQFHQGKIAEAFATLETGLGTAESSLARWQSLLNLAAFRFDEADAEPDEERLAASNAARGRLRRARGRDARHAALVRVVFLADANGALADLRGAPTRVEWETIDRVDRPYLDFAEAYALAGEPRVARQILAEYDTLESRRGRALSAGTRFEIEAWAALAEERPDAAVDAARRAAVPNCRVCGLLPLGRAYEQLGQPDSAIAVFERYLDTPHEARSRFLRLILLGDTYERLALLHEQRGNVESARVNNAKLVELWQDADPELQARVNAARRRLQTLAPG